MVNHPQYHFDHQDATNAQKIKNQFFVFFVSQYNGNWLVNEVDSTPHFKGEIETNGQTHARTVNTRGQKKCEITVKPRCMEITVETIA